MKYQNQIFLEKYALEKNKEFLKRLYKEDFNCEKWFDKKQGVSREKDSLTLEDFLVIMNKDAMIRLQIGSPNADRIIYGIRQPYGNSSRFFWIDCDYNDTNFNIFSNLFKEVFEKDIKSA